MQGITNLSRPSNKAVLEAAILLTLALAAIIIIHTFQRVWAGSPNQGHSVLLNTSNSSTGLSTDSPDADSGSANSSNSSSTKLTVNGQDIPVPQNGAVSQTVPNEGGGTSQVNTSSEQSSSTSASGTATNKSSTTINVNSSASSNSNQGGD